MSHNSPIWDSKEAESLPRPACDAEGKPTCSYAALVRYALRKGGAVDPETGAPKMTLSEIYDAVRADFPWFSREDAGQGWKNSIRHNLSVNRMFEKQARTDGDSANKGSYWLLNEDAAKDGCAISRRKRNRSRRKEKASPMPVRGSPASRRRATATSSPPPAEGRRRGPGPIVLSFDGEPPSASELIVSEPSPWATEAPLPVAAPILASPTGWDDPRSPLMSAMTDGYALTLAMTSVGFQKCASNAGLEDFSDVIWESGSGSDEAMALVEHEARLDQVVPAAFGWEAQAQGEPTTPGLLAVFPPPVPV